jgi:N-acyl-D-aspartate/D-glutamate deacylase
VVAGYGGCYASHIRGEGEDLLGALADFLAICQAAGLRGEVFHLKAAGRAHWDTMDAAIEMIERARAAGEEVTADVYPCPASSTGLTSIIPDRYHHPRSYGSFARVLGHYARDEKLQVTVADGQFTGPLAGRALTGRGRRP